MPDPDPAAPAVVDLSTPEGRAAAATALAAANNNPKVPAKFQNADGTLNQEAMLEAYTQLERKQAGVPDPIVAPDPVTSGPAPVTAAPTGDNTIDDLLRDPKVVESAVDWAALQTEVADTGEVSAETLAKVEAAGVPKEAVAAAITGWKLQAQEQFKRAADLVGGEEVLKATIAWAKQTYSPEQLGALSAALRGQLGEQTLMGLHQAFIVANPKSPLIDTSKSASAVGQVGPGAANAQIIPYRTKEEMFADMDDPKYKSDPDFQKHVAKRCAAGRGVDPARFDAR